MNGMPVFEIRRHRAHGYDEEYEVYELPSRAAPHNRSSRRLGGLSGPKLALVEAYLLRRLRRSAVRFEKKRNGHLAAGRIGEDEALRLALLFRAIAPMRSRRRIEAVAHGIERMGKEEAAYWLGMAIHRKAPRRVLSALRILAAELEIG